ncbi:glycosyltransferase family 4 protein [Flavobacterium macrobrachii]|uniref:Glycosyltransferase family 4 protein n=1 Tax=Flavobacterium macrobrachii TaxID=591204 RepID=A0ABS2CY07_9FLAO|nr:glycosyltransferase family 1 protein [Flavobacterium macrobrachii]MBM6499833.1 glycosyltransferase family 4 protein [Flavobacterium macrobrachii]
MDNNKFRLGFLFNFNPKWTGGIIYLVNSIRILNFLEDKDKPKVVVFYSPSLQQYIDEINYPYMELVPHQFPTVYKGFMQSFLKMKNVFVHDLVVVHKLDAVFPMHDYPVKSNLNAKLVSWIADLQHFYYPQFFTKTKILERNARIRFILRNSKDLVVSSHAVKNDFIKFFKMPSSLRVHVYHFVSIIEGLPSMTYEEIRDKYKLEDNYYMISNQFHKHKNHKVVFEAIAQLKKKGVEVCIGITGRFPEQPDSPYIQELHDIINKNDLKQNIKFLGLIPRGDQLLLMKYSKAIIQPSLFEGWSTVIEDAKSLQVPVIAANLDVNIEQLEELGTYFEPHNVEKLVSIMEKYPNRDFSKQIYDSYENRMKQAAYELLSVFK